MRKWVFQKVSKLHEPVGQMQPELFEKPTRTYYFQIEREKSYDYFSIIYITKLEILRKFRSENDVHRFAPPKKKIWLALPNPSVYLPIKSENSVSKSH